MLALLLFRTRGGGGGFRLEEGCKEECDKSAEGDVDSDNDDDVGCSGR